MAFSMNVAWHDANFALAWRDDARAVRTDQARALRLEELPRFHHVQRRNTLGDADDQCKIGIGCFHYGVGREWRRYKDYGSVGGGFVDGLRDRVEYRPAFVRGPALARRNTAHDLRAVISAGLRVEGSFASGQALNNESRILINQYAHRFLPMPLPRRQLFRPRLSLF